MKICAFDKLELGTKFVNCYDFDEVPSITLKFVKSSANSALRIKPIVFEGRPIYFRAKQPVAPIPKSRPRPKIGAKPTRKRKSK